LWDRIRENFLPFLEEHAMNSPHSQLRVQQNPLRATEVKATENKVQIELHFSVPLPAGDGSSLEENTTPAYLERRRKRRRRRHHYVAASERSYWSIFSVNV
jgi:hypothetical protein